MHLKTRIDIGTLLNHSDADANRGLGCNKPLIKGVGFYGYGKPRRTAYRNLSFVGFFRDQFIFCDLSKGAIDITCYSLYQK